MHSLSGLQSECKASPGQLSKTLQTERKAWAALKVRALASYV